MFIVGGFVFLLLSVVLTLSLPSVQTKIAQELTSSLNTKFLTNFKIDKVAIYINGTIAIKGVYVEDHRGDTLMYARSLGTSANSFQKLSSGIFDFDGFTVSDVDFNIVKYKGDEMDALSVLLNSLKPEVANKEKKVFKAFIEELAIENARFLYHDQNKENSSPFFLDSIAIQAKKFNVVGEFLDVQIKALTFQTAKKAFDVDQLSGDFSYDPCQLSFMDFKVKSNQNTLEGSLSLDYEKGGLNDFFNAVSLDVSLREAHILPTSLNQDLDFFPNKEPFKISLRAQGFMNALELNNIFINHPIIAYNGSVVLEHFFDRTVPQKLTASVDRLLTDIENYSRGSLKPPKWVKSIESLGQINTEGKVRLEEQTLFVTTTSTSTLGTLSTDANIGLGVFNTSYPNHEFKANIKLSNLALSDLVTIQSPWTTSGKLKVEGKIEKAVDIFLKWEGSGFEFSNPSHTLDRIQFEGSFENSILKNALISEAASLKFKSDGRLDFTKESSDYSFAINLIHADLVALGWDLGGGKAITKGIVLADFNGPNIDQLTGAIKLSSLEFENKDLRYEFNPVSIQQTIKDDLTELTIENTDFVQAKVKGNYRLSQIPPLFQNAFQEVYSFLPPAFPEPNQLIDFNVQLSNKILVALYPELSIDKNLLFKGEINAEKGKSKLSLNLPFLSFEDYSFENLVVNLDTQNPLYNTYLSFDQFKNSKYSLEKMDLISTSFKDTLFFRSEFNGGKTDQFELNFYHARDQKGVSHFGLKKSKVVHKGKTWELNPLNTLNQKISLDPKSKKVSVSGLHFKSLDQTIDVSGHYLNEKNTVLNLALKNIVLDDLLPEIPSFKVAGKTDLNLKYQRSKEDNSLTLSSYIKALNLNDLAMGDLKMDIKGNSEVNSYNIAMDLQKDSNSVLKGRGSMLGLTQPTLDIDFTLSDLNLAFLSPLGKEAVSDIRGLVSGDINLWGAINALQHSGQLNLQQGGISIPYLNVDFDFDTTAVSLYNQVFDFGSLKITDTKEKTTGNLRAKITHNNFGDWGTDLTINSERILVLNKPQEEEVVFFGTGYLDGSVDLSGPMNNLAIVVDGATERGTSIKIPWSEDYGISDTSFITFIDKSNSKNPVDLEDDQALTQIKGLEMTFDLDVNTNAAIEIVVDQETGSYLDGRGSGNLLMEINTNGKFNMWGDFITFGGIYNFKNLSVIDKKFMVRPGGTIVWEGDPLSAQMNLDAVYEVPGGANPALLLDNPNFNKKIPTEVVIRLQGNLLKPDNPIFEIDFPNTSNTVVSEINYRLADPQRSQLQALSLLSQGIFISNVGVSMQGITNNLYQKASDIFSSLIGDESDKLKVGVDFLQGDRSNTLDVRTEDRLGLTLFTQISDRILINGKIGVPVGGVEETLIVGNVQIDFILNEEGSLKAKVFNKENEFRYLTDELGYTQGVGFSYDVDFNTFRDLINKITQREQKKKTTVINTDPFKQTGINFINKN